MRIASAAAAVPPVHVSGHKRSFHDAQSGGGGGPSIAMSQPSQSNASSAVAAPSSVSSGPPKHAKSSSSTSLPVTSIRPTRYVRAWLFEKELWHTIGGPDVRQVLVINLPAVLYPSEPRSFTRLSHKIPTSEVINWIRMKRLLFYLANTVSQPSFPQDEEDGEGGVGRGKKAKRQRVDPKFTVDCYWEIVPRADDREQPACYRFFFIAKAKSSDDSGMTWAFSRLVENNQEHKWLETLRPGVHAEHRKPAGVTLGETSIQDGCLGHQEWQRICSQYAPHINQYAVKREFGSYGTVFIRPEERVEHPMLQKLMNSECPILLDNVFSVENALNMARKAGADPRFCDPAIYGDATANELRFADETRVWKVMVEDIEWQHLQNVFMPHIRPDQIEFADARERYVRIHAGPRPSPEARTRLEHEYDFNIAVTTNNDLAMDTYLLDRTVAGEKAQIHARYPNDARSVYLECQERAKKVWIPMLKRILDPDNLSAPPSLLAIGAAKHAYLESMKHSFWKLRKRTTKNLTRFQDYTAQIMSTLSTIATVRTNHRDCYQYWLCANHVYIGSELNPHVLSLGPPGVGKSFAAKLVYYLAIDGTVRNVSDMTRKAFNIEGNANDYVILIFDDAKGSMLGVGNNAKMRNNPSSDMEALIKEILANREVTTQTMNVLEDGKRVHVYIKAPATIVCIFILNESKSKFSAPILDRHIVKVNSNHDAPGEEDESVPDMIACLSRSDNPVIKNAMSNLKSMCERKQILFAHILILIKSGALPDVELSMANVFFMLVKSRARKLGLDMDGIRKFKRWGSMVRMLVVESVIDYWWGSPTSPLAPRDGKIVPHSDEHFLLVGKHLYAQTEHIILALGMMADQWKDDLRNRVLTAMVKVFIGGQEKLDDAIKKRAEPIKLSDTRPTAVYNAMPDDTDPDSALIYDGMKDELEHWTHLSSTMSSYKPLSSTMPVSGKKSIVKVYSNDELAHHVASQLMEHLHPQPLIGEVEGVLKDLMVQNVTEKRQVIHEVMSANNSHVEQEIRTETKKVSALLIEPARVRIALTTLQHHDLDVLFQSVQEVACMLHHGATPKVYQYGEPNPLLPSVWTQMEAKHRDFPEREKRIFNANCFDRIDAQLTHALLHADLSSDESKLPELSFEDNEFTQCDVDIDEMVALKHGTTMGMSRSERLAQPSNDAAALEKEWQNYWDRVAPTNIRYPQDFVRFKKGRSERMLQEKQQRNPEMYKMSTQMKALHRLEEKWDAQTTAAASSPAPSSARSSPMEEAEAEAEAEPSEEDYEQDVTLAEQNFGREDRMDTGSSDECE